MADMLTFLAQRIRTTGPISIADYMAECLMHPKHGYYQKEQIFGAQGDFITAPEISQMFGEMVGLWLAGKWQAMGCPKQVNLIELGPGRGTLMKDMLLATKKLPGFHAAVSVHFIELSAQLRQLQKNCVSPLLDDLTWHDSLASVPAGPSLLIANEFFDALPVHQYQKSDGTWCERVVSLDESDHLSLTLAKASAQFSLVPAHLRDAKNGAIVEVCPLALSIMGDISDRLKQHGGAALIIDYGYDKAALGDSFQALKNHQYCDPLAGPGTADLTAHVNFESLKTVAEQANLASLGPLGQGDFLKGLGIAERAGRLANGKQKAIQADILNALVRLTSADEMGDLFRVLAVTKDPATEKPQRRPS